MPACRRISRPRAWSSTRPMPARFATTCARRTSTATGRPSSATRAGPCWNAASASCPEPARAPDVEPTGLALWRPGAGDLHMKHAVRLDDLAVDPTRDALGHALPEAANGPIASRAGRPRGWLARVDRALGWLVEVPAAVLVVADIGVLLAGVVARFVFRSPLV